MNNSRRAITIGLVLAFVFMSRQVVAQSEDVPARGPISFSAYDQNEDGAISEEEFYEVRGKRMAGRAAEGRPMRGAADAPAFSDFDGDGVLIEKEFQEARTKRISERAKQGYQMRNLGKAPAFGDLDADGDGRVTREEFAVHQAQRLQSQPQQ